MLVEKRKTGIPILLRLSAVASIFCGLIRVRVPQLLCYIRVHKQVDCGRQEVGGVRLVTAVGSGEVSSSRRLNKSAKPLESIIRDCMSAIPTRLLITHHMRYLSVARIARVVRPHTSSSKRLGLWVRLRFAH